MNRKRPDVHPDARGFTLIEVMVALAIAAMGVAAIVAAARGGLANGALSGRYAEATRRAESRLAEVGVVSALSPREQSGDDGGGFSWHSRIALSGVRPVSNGAVTPALYDVEVDISWPEGGSRRSVMLRSQRFATVAPHHG